MNIPEAEPIYTTQYTNFKGVDFTSTIPDRNRFPIGKNFVIADDVHKRNGYEIVHQYEGRINGVYKFELRDTSYTIVHAGNKLYNAEDMSNPTPYGIEVADNKSSGFLSGDKFILMTGEEFVLFTMSKLSEYEKLAELTLSGTPSFVYRIGDRDWDEVYVINDDGTESKLEHKTDYIVGGATVYMADKSVFLHNAELVNKKIRVTYYKGSSSVFTASEEKWGTFTDISSITGEDFASLSEHMPMEYSDDIYDKRLISGAFYDIPYSDKKDYVFIPYHYKKDKAYIPYISKNKSTEDDDSRYFFSIYVFGTVNSSPSLYDFFNNIPIPTIRRNVGAIESKNLSSETFIEKYGEVTGETYNILTPYIAFETGDFKTLGASSDSSEHCGYYLLDDKDDEITDAYAILENGILLHGTILKATINKIRYSGVKFSYNTDYDGMSARIILKTKKSEKLFSDISVFESSSHAHLQYGNGVYHFYANIPKHPNRDYHSELENPLYIRADSYSIYGASDDILGYSSYGQYLAVLKKGETDNNIYIRRAEYNSELGVTFPISVGVGGAVSGLSAETIKNLNGETLYLSSDGIYALTSLSTSDFRVTRKRSFYIDGKLKEEPNLTEATACVWNNRYLLGVNGNVYILDGTQPKDYIEGTNNEYSYECLFWDNIPARVFFPYGDELYFGTENGEVFKFNEGYEDNGKPVELVLATRLDDDGDFMSLKRVKKKGTGMMVNPFSRSSFEVAYRYDDYLEQPVKTVYADIFDFSDIDFSRISFNPSDAPRVIPFMKKSKKYKLLQIIMRSLNKEPFSLMGIIKRFTINNFVKK